jgi:hypothetical protein
VPVGQPESHRPTSASVTAKPCTCKYLEHSADDPTLPITFDEETGEYQYQCCDSGSHGLSMLVIRHCPWCGGAAPKSKRSLLFHVIPPEEAQRLAKLIGRVSTLRAAIRKLGPPDEDDPDGLSENMPETDGRPPSVQWFRTLRYTRLSEVADVWFDERGDGHARWQLLGKPRRRDRSSRRRT